MNLPISNGTVNVSCLCEILVIAYVHSGIWGTIMKLHGIEFGNVLGASGVQGFFGEGYWFHHWLRAMRLLDYSQLTFVSKTTTLQERKGNMPMNRDFTPRDRFPDCVKVKPLRGQVLNSVGLTGPGLEELLRHQRWQMRQKPFFISIMSVAGSTKERLEELRQMVHMIKMMVDGFYTHFALQINMSCPNTGHDPAEMIGESADVLDIAACLGVPLMLKYSIASAPIHAIAELEQHPYCDAVCVSNTLPFGWEGLDWKKVFGTNQSPLEKIGGGGLSGAPLRPLVCEWIQKLRDAGFTRPVNGGGGILCKRDVDAYHQAGASSIFLGSVVILRPWRVKGIIDHANSLDWSVNN